MVFHHSFGPSPWCFSLLEKWYTSIMETLVSLTRTKLRIFIRKNVLCGLFDKAKEPSCRIFNSKKWSVGSRQHSFFESWGTMIKLWNHWCICPMNHGYAETGLMMSMSNAHWTRYMHVYVLNMDLACSAKRPCLTRSQHEISVFEMRDDTVNLFWILLIFVFFILNILCIVYFGCHLDIVKQLFSWICLCKLENFNNGCECV